MGTPSTQTRASAFLCFLSTLSQFLATRSKAQGKVSQFIVLRPILVKANTAKKNENLYTTGWREITGIFFYFSLAGSR